MTGSARMASMQMVGLALIVLAVMVRVGGGWLLRRGEPADGNWEPANNKAEFTTGERVFHQKFGMGNILTIDGDKLLIAFDKAGHKKVVSGFVSKP